MQRIYLVEFQFVCEFLFDRSISNVCLKAKDSVDITATTTANNSSLGSLPQTDPVTKAEFDAFSAKLSAKILGWKAVRKLGEIF